MRTALIVALVAGVLGAPAPEPKKISVELKDVTLAALESMERADGDARRLVKELSLVEGPLAVRIVDGNPRPMKRRLERSVLATVRGEQRDLLWANVVTKKVDDDLHGAPNLYVVAPAPDRRDLWA